MKKKSKSDDPCNTCEDHRSNHQHPDHTKELNRLSRISGQVEGVKKMVQGRAYCPDILIQTKAIRSALRSFETNILSNHIEHCVRDAFTSKDKKDVQSKIAELMEIFKKLEA